MIGKPFIKVLKIIFKKLRGKKVNWVLIGSSSLALEGMKIKPKDIDILTTKKGAFEFNKVFKKWEIESVKFKESKFFRSYFGEFKIEGVRVEVMGKLERKIEGKWIPIFQKITSKKWVKIGKAKIPIPSLKDQFQIYKKIGRRKDLQKLEMIKKALI